ncbi:hypothetical protein [Cognatilysobacter bugurensis]|uniref:Copper resistance protein NlpE n=1 Tax=Cognatilysobacter bugurensis TaxID=543356 RepID=A0A918SVI4_9GAMM|nr:hypothetical protein [Lysobacter bugurensis]GHA70965.1 hypothetical protein GCM10007067_04020 [Lysobacter bugurensis]
MIRSIATLTCLALSLAACNRDEPAPAAETPAPVAAPAVEAPPAEVAPAPAAPAAFEMRDYAGTFVAGGDRLELGADGVYRLSEGGAMRDGTWTVEENDTRVRLDPNSKSEADRVFAMDGRDRLMVLDEAGQTRAGAAPWAREAVPAQ